MVELNLNPGDQVVALPGLVQAGSIFSGGCGFLLDCGAQDSGSLRDADCRRDYWRFGGGVCQPDILSGIQRRVPMVKTGTGSLFQTAKAGVLGGFRHWFSLFFGQRC